MPLMIHQLGSKLKFRKRHNYASRVSIERSRGGFVPFAQSQQIMLALGLNCSRRGRLETLLLAEEGLDVAVDGWL